MGATVTVSNLAGEYIDVLIDERVGSRKLTTGDKAKDDLLFFAQGPNSEAMDDIAAQYAIYAVTPETYGGLVFDHVDGLEHQGAGLWYGTAKYVNPNNTQQTGKSLIAFDTAGAREKIYVGLADIVAYPTGSAADYKRSIGVDGDKVEGCEITVPQYKLTVTFYVPNSSVTTSYIGVLYALTGTVCNGTFYGMDEGECLFLGAKGSRRGRGDWELTFEFAGSPNATGLNIGGITGVAKKGWQYLTVRFQKSPSGSGVNAVIVQTALSVQINTVYNETDFSTLGVGTAFPTFP